MINTYVISLKKENYDILLNNNNHVNTLNINWFNAIDGTKIIDKNIIFNVNNNWFDPHHFTPMTQGEVGCALSHYKVWELIKNDNVEYSLILEDDIYFEDNFNEKIKSLINTIPKDADLIYLNRKALFPDNENQTNDWYKVLYSYWTNAYILTNKGINKLLDSNFLSNLIPIDEFLPILYDSNKFNNNLLVYNNINNFNAYYNNNYNIINLNKNAFNNSTTFFSKIYQPININLYALGYTLNINNTSVNRWKYSCELYGIPYNIFTSFDDILLYLNNNKNIIAIICYPEISFFINNPHEIFKKYNLITNNSIIKSDNFLIGNSQNIINYFNNSFNLITNDKLNNLFININPNINYSIINKQLVLDSNITPIILYSTNHSIILNNIENYTLYGILNSYGLKLLNNFKYQIINVYIICIDNNILHNLNFINNINLEYIKLNIKILSNFSYLNNILIEEKDILSFITNDININKPDYIWIIDSKYLLNNNNILIDCINADRNIISGLIVNGETLLSNFWGDLSDIGYYKRSHDYCKILNRELISIWNVPHIRGNLLIKYETFINNNYIFNDDLYITLCNTFLKNNELMYLLNKELYGTKIYDINDNNDNINLIKLFFNNKYWSYADIFHPLLIDFIDNNNNNIFKEIKSDIWQFPFFTDEFCDGLVILTETINNWSNGGLDSVYDVRINNTENHPTQDIHLSELNLDIFWKSIINKILSKIMLYLYNYKVKEYNISFIAKFTLDTQPSLGPHHDSSVYTTNVSLNNEYTGCGINFISKKIIIYNKKGYMLLHPGRLTHYHETLPITSGKKYILVSFNN